MWTMKQDDQVSWWWILFGFIFLEMGSKHANREIWLDLTWIFEQPALNMFNILHKGQQMESNKHSVPNFSIKCDKALNPAEQWAERSLETRSLSPLERWYLATWRDAISPCRAKWCHFLWWYNLARLWEIKGPSDVLPLLLKKRLCSPSNLPPPAIFFVHRFSLWSGEGPVHVIQVGVCTCACACAPKCHTSTDKTSGHPPVMESQCMRTIGVIHWALVTWVHFIPRDAHEALGFLSCPAALLIENGNLEVVHKMSRHTTKQDVGSP